MVGTAKKMNEAYQKIREFRESNSLLINQIFDPNKTGFIGEEFSVITTTLGNLEAKQTALNHDFAALIVKWIKELAVPRNKNVIIHASASFPGLTIMAILACENLNLNPLIISSVGSSSWGANFPPFTYLDIESYLYQQGILKHRSTFVTPGGNNDNGSSLWEGGLDIVKSSAQRNNYELNIPASLGEAIEKKWELINRLNAVLFINIGGNHSALGNGNCALNIPVGKISQPLKCSANGIKGLIYKCCDKGIPVIHLLNIKEIASTNGINLNPVPFPEPGESDLYFEKSISLSMLLSSITIIILFLFFQGRKNNSYKIPSISRTISTNLK